MKDFRRLNYLYGFTMNRSPYQLIDGEEWAAWTLCLNLPEDDIDPELLAERDGLLAEHLERVTTRAKEISEQVQEFRDKAAEIEASEEMQTRLAYYNKIHPRITFPEFQKEANK
jgi:hypothetical protein